MRQTTHPHRWEFLERPPCWSDEFFRYGIAWDVRRCVDSSAETWAPDASGRTRLHEAALKGRNSSVAVALIEAGFSSEAQDKEGNTALHLAAEHNHSGIALALIGAGASLEARTNEGLTPLHLAAIRSSSLNSRQRGATTIVMALLKAGADPNVGSGSGTAQAQTHRGWTPLHYAVSRNYGPGTVTALLEAGADPNAKGSSDMTPLHLAALRGRHPAGSAIRAILTFGYGLADDARFNGASVDIVEALLEHGADPLATNQSGKRPLDLTRNSGLGSDPERIKSLLEGAMDVEP